MGRSGAISDRAATDKSVHGITAPGECWAVDVKVVGSNSDRLRRGSIAHFWGAPQDAEANAARITAGGVYYKADPERRYFDAAIRPARAYWT